MRLFVMLILQLTMSVSYGQTRSVSGVVQDTIDNPLKDVLINLKSVSENIFVKTNDLGIYRFKNVASIEFTLNITSIGFENYNQAYIVKSKSANAFIIDPIRLKVQIKQLPEVVLYTNPITIKEDTIEYRADAYKVREGSSVEDVLKKLPGVTVDKNGTVIAQGKEVIRVRVNGKDYFGGDVQTATQNLPADIIENIQIIDDYGGKANITGIKEGESEKILNINVKKGKNTGSFGNFTMAAGTRHRYLGKVAENNFKQEKQLSFLGSSTNTNANIFNFNGGGLGGGARGAGMGNNQFGVIGDGTTYYTSLGINYRDSWSKKFTSYGSYSYSKRKNNTRSSSFQQDFNPQQINSISRIDENHSNSYNHRLTWNLEYKMDSLNYSKISPYFSYASSRNSNNGISEYSKSKYYTLNNGKSESTTYIPSWGTDFFYIHKFKRRGRNFNISGNINYSASDQKREVKNDYFNIDSTFSTQQVNQTNQNQLIGNNNVNRTTNFNFSFEEPLSNYTALEASYQWKNLNTKSIRDVNDVNGITGDRIRNIKQNSDYAYQFITNRIGLCLHTYNIKYNYLLGIIAQPSVLTGIDETRNITTRKTNFNIAPSAHFSYNFSNTHSLTASYGGTSREPYFIQMQPIIDSSNMKNIIVGNPNLKPEFTNRFRLQYNKVNILSGTSFFANISFDQTQNKIVSTRFNDPNGTGTTTSYLNTNGFCGFNGNISISQPIANKKLSVLFNTSGSYTNNISFTDNQKNNGLSWTFRPDASLLIDFPDIIDVNINGSYIYNKNTTRYPTYAYNSIVKTVTYGIDGKSYFLKNWTFGYEFIKFINTGFKSTVNNNPILLNLYLEYRFLKNNKGFVRLQSYDLFNQNTGISREIKGTTVMDIQNNRLNRYFLLSFNLRWQKFAGR